jgi:hypothetical protein
MAPITRSHSRYTSSSSGEQVNKKVEDEEVINQTDYIVDIIYTEDVFIDPYIIETRNKLKVLLDSTRSNKIHHDKISKCLTLKDAHIYCKTNNLSSQFVGPALERYMINKFKMKKNKASSCTGDVCCNGTNYEIKVSSGGKDHTDYNYVQIRMNHKCKYILTAYHIDYENYENLGELYLFILEKDEMKELILKYGGYAHGVNGNLGKINKNTLEETQNNKEYAIRPKLGGKCWNSMLQYKVDESFFDEVSVCSN